MKNERRRQRFALLPSDVLHDRRDPRSATERRRGLPVPDESEDAPTEPPRRGRPRRDEPKGADALEAWIKDLAERAARAVQPPPGASPERLRNRARRNAELYLATVAFNLKTTELAERLGRHRTSVWRAVQAGRALVEASRTEGSFGSPGSDVPDQPSRRPNRRIRAEVKQVARTYQPPVGTPRPDYLRGLAARNAELYLTAEALGLNAPELARRLGRDRTSVWRALRAGRAVVEGARAAGPSPAAPTPRGFSHPDRGPRP